MEKLLIIALGVVCVSLPVHSAVISHLNGVIHCDGIICPQGSTGCIVSKRTFGDLNFYKYIRLCTDGSDIPTHRVEQEFPNPQPGTVINVTSLIGGNRTLTEEERKELEATMNKVVEDTNEMVQKQNNYWNQWTKDFNDKMTNMFPPGFPFN